MAYHGKTIRRFDEIDEEHFDFNMYLQIIYTIQYLQHLT